MNSSKKIIKRVENDLKPHNAETIKNILEIYETSNKCCAIQATGTGKTFLILRLLEIYNDEGKSAIIFAPNREIIKQTKKRMKKFGLNNAIFYTYQKLARMTDEEIADIKADLIVCDELHRTGAKTWGQKFEVLVGTHSDSKVFGVTATPLRCTDGRDMTEEYFDGNKACNISLAEALVREIIPVMPLYVSALYTFEEEYQNMSEKIEKGNNSVEEKAELQKELLAAKQQLEKANGVPEIIKKYITNYNGKYLVFCKDKKHLYAMKDVVIGWFRESGYNGKIFEYPYYSNSSSVRKNLENFENNKEEGLKLLFVIDKLNEGLHLDEVHGCILLRTTISNIIYYQQIGRAIDAGSNEQRVILDLVSNFNSLKSFNLKKELKEKVKERQNGNFSDCSEEFELDKFDVVDCVQKCVDVFNKIDNYIKNKWEKSYMALKQYYEREGNSCPVKNTKELYGDELINIGQFAATNRCRYSKGELTKEQISKLNDIDFIFDVNKEKFITNINACKEFMKLKNISVNDIKQTDTYNGINIGIFLNQCNKKLKNEDYLKNNKWKIRYLEDLGFSITGRRNDKFKTNCLEYKKIKEKYGYIPDSPIRKWEQYTRRLFKKNQLSQSQIEMLKKSNFDFSPLNTSHFGIKVKMIDKQNKVKIYNSITSLINDIKKNYGITIYTNNVMKVLDGVEDNCYGLTFEYA